MNLAVMTLMNATVTEKAAGEVAEMYDKLDLSGQEIDKIEQQSIRAAAKEAEQVAWRNHHKAAYEATKRFLQQAEQGIPRRKK